MKPRCNLHIHSTLSDCASREMTVARIVAEAERAGLQTIGLADHVDRSDPGREAAVLANFQTVERLRPPINVLIGCETTQIRPNVFAVSEAAARQLDFVIVAANHYHLDHVENPADTSPAGYAAHYLRMLEGAIDWGLATVIAHPFLLGKVRSLNHAQVLAAYDRNELRRILRKAADCHVALELNPAQIRAAPAFLNELAAIGRELNLKFAPGTDAHQPAEIPYSQTDIETLHDIGLGETDLLVLADGSGRKHVPG